MLCCACGGCWSAACRLGEIVAASGVQVDCVGPLHCTLCWVLTSDVLSCFLLERCSCSHAWPTAGGVQGHEAAPLECPKTLMH